MVEKWWSRMMMMIEEDQERERRPVQSSPARLKQASKIVVKLRFPFRFG